MPKIQANPSKRAGSIAVCWRAARKSYRLANLASHHVLGALVKSLVLVYFIFGILFLCLRYLVLPNIDQYKGNIEQLASRTLGHSISIERIYASWHGLKPHLFLGDVVLRDKDGRPALSLPSVAATLSWWSVMAADLRFDSLEISRPELDIRRERDGKLYVAGMYVDPDKDGDGKGLDWVLSQHEIAIHEGRVRWTDSLRGAPELALDGVNLVLRNRWRRHRMALQATPPAPVAAPIDVRADFVHPRFASRISDVRRWQGELFAQLPDTDLAVWKAYFDYPVELQQGKGSVRAWLELDHARLADFTADLTLSNVAIRLRKDLDVMNLARVSGRISAREDFEAEIDEGTPTFGTRGHTLALTDFSVQTSEGLFLPATNISETFVPAKQDKPEKFDIRASLLDLQMLANFAGRLPLSAGQRQMLADFAPQGLVKDFSAEWQGAYPEIASYHIKGQFAGLSLKGQAPRPGRLKAGAMPAQAAAPGIPGFENLSGRVEASDRGGNVSLDSDRLKLQLPGYFTDPVMLFDKLKMQASWTFEARDQVLFQVGRMDFVQQGLAGSLTGSHLAPLKPQQDQPLGSIDVSGTIGSFDLKTIGRYLPLQTPERLHHWLTGALEEGLAREVSVRLKGDLAHFPFQSGTLSEKKGEFRVAGLIQNGKLNYSPGSFARDGKSPYWPQAEQIQGSFLFERGRMEIKADSARTMGAGLSNVKAVIPNLLADEMLVDIDGSASASLQDFVRYVNASPVYEWIARFTEETRASGNARLGIKLQLPLAHLPDAKVQGSLQFLSNDVVLQACIPPLSSANGKLEFSERGFNLNGVSASFLGGAVALSGGTQRDGATQVKANGSITPDGLRATYPGAAMERLAGRISGSARYAALIGIKRHQAEVTVESSLQGLGLDFPAPLRKAANESMPFKFVLSGLAQEDPAVLRDEMKLSLGSSIAVRYQRQKAAEKDASWQVMRGGIGVNVPAPEPDSGLTANVEMKSLDIDAWRAVLASMVGAGGERAAGSPPDPNAGSDADTLNIAQYIEPEVLAARARELIVLGKKLDNVVVGASHQKGVWQTNIDSTQASGYLTWNESASGQGLGKVTARLSSLIIPRSAAPEVTELLEGKNVTTQIPALDVLAENFELFGKKLGRLEVAASNAQTGMGREWRIDKLALTNPDAELKASGKWRLKDGQSHTSLAYALEIANSGKLLERFGFINLMSGGKGKMDGELDWKGLPFSLDIPSLSGSIRLDLEAGQFLKVDPGAAKLLGVLSLQALPRLLKLDFRDVFSEGFRFDGINANASIVNGVARTDNLKMRSVNATVLMDGSADIEKETQNLHVVVIPEINVGTASVVYGLAVNPVLGLGSFLAQLFLRQPLMKAFTFHYQITGGWKDPNVNKIDSKIAHSGVSQTDLIKHD